MGLILMHCVEVCLIRFFSVGFFSGFWIWVVCGPWDRL